MLSAQLRVAAWCLFHSSAFQNAYSVACFAFGLIPFATPFLLASMFIRLAEEKELGHSSLLYSRRRKSGLRSFPRRRTSGSFPSSMSEALPLQVASRGSGLSAP